MKKIYIMLSKTNTILCSLIQSYTKEPYAHVSLLFDDNFLFGYSFSRKKVHNPFLGGFMKEDYIKWVAAFPETECLIYQLKIKDTQWNHIHQKVLSFYAHKEKYRYNRLGLLTYMMGIHIKPKDRYFCSQFVSYILQDANALSFNKAPEFTTAKDFKNHPALSLIYEGNLKALLHEKGTLC